MKKRTPRVHLTDILDSIAAVIAYANQLTKEQFSVPGPMRDGIVLRLALVGEFAYQLGEKWRSQHPEIEWGKHHGDAEPAAPRVYRNRFRCCLGYNPQ